MCLLKFFFSFPTFVFLRPVPWPLHSYPHFIDLPSKLYNFILTNLSGAGAGGAMPGPGVENCFYITVVATV